jgi:cytochrome c peroxidase
VLSEDVKAVYNSWGKGKHDPRTKMYRTSPLRGIWQHPPYFHNGTAQTLDAVVQTYNEKKCLGLTPEEVADLVQYLKSL